MVSPLSSTVRQTVGQTDRVNPFGMRNDVNNRVSWMKERGGVFSIYIYVISINVL